MTRDWLLTLLATSPFLFAATIVVLALIGKQAQNERVGRRRRRTRPYGGAGQFEASRPYDHEASSR
jgi:hypothetical protein